MLEPIDWGKSFLGAGLLLSAFTLPALAADTTLDSGAPTEPIPAASANIDVESYPEIKASQKVTSGALTGLIAPKYDGPVVWGMMATKQEAGRLVLAMSVLGGVAGAGLAAKVIDDRSGSTETILGSAAVGALMLAGIGAVATPTAYVREFSTTIASVERADAPHMETHGSTKNSRTIGPYYGQIVTIPETALLLSTNAKGAPLIAGQKIHAHVYYDSQHRIVSWFAEAGER